MPRPHTFGFSPPCHRLRPSDDSAPRAKRWERTTSAQPMRPRPHPCSWRCDALVPLGGRRDAGRRILVVEDNPFRTSSWFRENVLPVRRINDVPPSEAHSGEEGLPCVAEEDPPDLVLDGFSNSPHRRDGETDGRRFAAGNLGQRRARSVAVTNPAFLGEWPRKQGAPQFWPALRRHT